MTKYENLHAKIKSVRQTLGLKQKDFVVKVSQQLGLKDAPYSAGLASQWENRHTTPTPEQIVAIANLTKTPEWHMIWFMLDQVPAKRGIRLHPDGSYEFPAEAEAGARPLSQLETEPFKEYLTEWKTDPRQIHHLRGLLAEKHLQHQVNETIDATLKTSHMTEAATARDEVSAEVVRWPHHTERSKQAGPYLDDIVKFPPRGGLEMLKPMQRTAADNFAERIERIETFYKVMSYNLEEVQGIGSVSGGLRREFNVGVINTKADFYAYGVAASLIFLERSRPIRMLRWGLKDVMANLLLVERMQGKSSKKLIVFCTYESNLDLTPLKEHLSEAVQSAELLNFKIEFASGPEQAAYAIAQLSQTFHDAR
jgi:hypothetical protein